MQYRAVPTLCAQDQCEHYLVGSAFPIIPQSFVVESMGLAWRLEIEIGSGLMGNRTE
ncbi:hypothetical protein AGR2A_pa40012 [Agrobacterium genomosp. 2 str. CFBP 5494]|uniref:Uncharacterized protein n=1 Tax=Agrobacterium genomosp. 2 str. CFBP 5494 TaxID=1183436 RepID=A0A9W5F2N6_9HYPH|nr:hypothetical protein AGR2A_pa40012 [Agrobacterium genomosp. 2 str. CFBP 5494]